MNDSSFRFCDTLIESVVLVLVSTQLESPLLRSSILSNFLANDAISSARGEIIGVGTPIDL